MKPYKVTCPWIVKEQRAHKMALARWYSLGRGLGDPWWPTMNYGGKGATGFHKNYEAIVLYATAIGRKTGVLPENMSGWLAARSEGGVTFAEGANKLGQYGGEFRAVREVFVPINLKPSITTVEYQEAA